MNKSAITFAMVIALAAVFALVTPMDVAVAQTSNPVPDGDGGEYKDGEHREGKSCPNKEKKMQNTEQLT